MKKKKKNKNKYARNALPHFTLEMIYGFEETLFARVVETIHTCTHAFRLGD